MEIKSSSTLKPRRTQLSGSFCTPSRIPRMKDSLLNKTFSTCAPENLFSVSAVFTSLTQEGYNFTFVHEGRKQKAVLDKTFLTGLEKDNVRITWEQARRELKSGHKVRVDVTQLKSKTSDQKWLVFGLYFYTIFFLGFPSSGKLAGVRPEVSCKHKSDVGWAAKFKGENSSSIRSTCQPGDKISLLEHSPSLQEVESSTSKENNGNASLLDLDNSSDASFSISCGSVSESEEACEDFSMLANPDLATSHMEEALVDEGVRLPDQGIYFDSLVLSSCLPTDASVIEAQFEKVLDENGLLENYHHLAAAFDLIFEESSSNPKSTTSLDNDILDTTNSFASELCSSSSFTLSSELTPYSKKKVPVRSGPEFASTPAEKCIDGDCSSYGSESSGTFSPVNMDSGYYESFSSGSLLEMTSDGDESSHPKEETFFKTPFSVTGGFVRQFLLFSVKQTISELASCF